MEQSISWEMNSNSVKLSALHGTQRCISMFTRSWHWSLSWAICIQFTPFHCISLRPILISYCLCLDVPRDLFPSGFPTNILYAFLISLMSATCSSHLIILDLLTLTMFGEAYKLWSTSLCILLHPPATSSLLGPNILLSTLFSHTFNLCSSLSLRNQVSCPYKTTGKLYSSVYFNLNVFREEPRRQKILNWTVEEYLHQVAKCLLNP